MSSVSHLYNLKASSKAHANICSTSVFYSSKYLVSGGFDSKILLWDLTKQPSPPPNTSSLGENKREEKQKLNSTPLKSRPEHCFNLALSANTGQMLNPPMVHSLCRHPDVESKYVYAGLGSSEVGVFDLKTRKEVLEDRHRHLFSLIFHSNLYGKSG